MHILIAEDEQHIANSLKRSFSAEGHQAVVAVNGKEALELIEQNNFDVLLLDWRMPVLTGIEVCKSLRASSNNIPIILLTAMDDISSKIEALNFGADDYITKPFSFKEVLARINAVIRRYNTQNNTQTFEEFELNLVSHVLTSPNGEIKLPEKEFELLNYFLSNKNSILSKEHLAKEVWQLSFLPETNFIEATVKNLRKKLEEFSSRKFIKTIYGEGYIFVSE